jgi:predicted DNA-binding antitoxin AbrB/MazE fold protein
VRMTLRVEAIYEDGVLRPLTPVDLTESQRVTILISEAATGPSQPDRELLARARAEVAAMRQVPTIDEVRGVLAKIPGSLADDLNGEREDR